MLGILGKGRKADRGKDGCLGDELGAGGVHEQEKAMMERVSEGRAADKRARGRADTQIQS